MDVKIDDKVKDYLKSKNKDVIKIDSSVQGC
jgi:hypothetical protein